MTLLPKRQAQGVTTITSASYLPPGYNTSSTILTITSTLQNSNASAQNPTQTPASSTTNASITTFTFVTSANTTGPQTLITSVTLLPIEPIGTSQPTSIPELTKSSVSTGAIAGIAIATAILGALIAAAVLIMLSKRRKRKEKVQQRYGAINSSHQSHPDEHGEKTKVAAGYQNVDFDLDRLLPQPLDDATMKQHTQHFFSQIDGHVENFYTDGPVEAGVNRLRAHTDIAEKLFDPISRLFAIKQIICQTLLDSISPDSPSDRSFLPYGYASLSRRLKEPDLDDQAISLCWSRLRTSLAFLLKPDATTEQTRLDSAISIMVQELSDELQAFETPGTTPQRRNDLDALCRSCASFGRILLSQPAVWTFDWPSGRNVQGQPNAAIQGSRSRLVYFPAMIRLTDNKSRKASRPHVAMRAQAMQEGGAMHKLG